LFEARENGRELFSKCYALEEKKEFYDYLFKDTALKYTPDQQKKILLDSEFATMSVALAKNTGIHLTRYSNKSFSDEDNEILKKFAKVFDQAYTRFLDLQKAEAQAREAQIELALERVRARTMAMQNSDELAELVAVLFKELTHLDFLLTSCIIWINDPELSTNTLWVTSSEMNKPARPLSITPFYHSFFKSIIHAWKAKDPKWIYTLRGEEKSSFEKSFFNDVPDLPDALKAALTVPKEAVFSASFNNFGALEVLGTEPLSEEKFNILHRFGKVFDSSYTRFNDLKQAEAQARESQIQLALERVRARTMAMQKSDELPETSLLLFQQMKELGETAVQNSIGIINEEAGIVELSTTIQGNQLTHTIHVPIDDPYVMAKGVAAWKAKRKSLIVEFTGQELKDYNEHRNSFFETKRNFPEDRWIANLFFFSKGWLSFSSDKNISGESFELLKRFAAVFEQTYIRFSDLKQAEEQARESQIQLAMERVRARTMAMQKSDELAEDASVLFTQI